MPPSIDFDPSKDFYKALGVDSKASADEIKKAYRKLAKANHPDSTGGDKSKESRFKDISNAYDVLGDTKKRDLYDQIRAGGGMRGGGGGFPGGVSYTQGGPGGPNVFDLNDLFGQFFQGGPGGMGPQGGRGRGGRPGPGQGRARARDVEDVEFETKIKASDGTYLRVEGADFHSDARISWDRAILGTVATVATVDGKAEVKIPPGTSSGKKLRLRGKGATQGRHTGDHYVTVQIDVPGADLDDATRKQVVELAQRLRKRGGGE